MMIAAVKILQVKSTTDKSSFFYYVIVIVKFDEDCYATDAVYTLYIPTLMAMPFIVLTEYRVSWDYDDFLI